MTSDQLVSERFRRSSRYHPDWVLASASGGANALWVTEWLTSALDLRPGMRVLDLGCGRASSSIFLRREFGVQVWATDLWFSASENMQRVLDAGVEDVRKGEHGSLVVFANSVRRTERDENGDDIEREIPFMKG